MAICSWILVHLPPSTLHLSISFIKPLLTSCIWSKPVPSPFSVPSLSYHPCLFDRPASRCTEWKTVTLLGDRVLAVSLIHWSLWRSHLTSPELNFLDYNPSWFTNWPMVQLAKVLWFICFSVCSFFSSNSLFKKTPFSFVNPGIQLWKKNRSMVKQVMKETT